MGEIRVGRRIYSGNGFQDPTFEGFTPIVCLTKSTAYGSLGPYVLKNAKGQIMENLYQFSKCYERVPAHKERYSRYDSTVTWDHPAEIHWKDGKPTEEMIAWRLKGLNNSVFVRYPVGKDYRSKCLGSYTQDNFNNYLEGKEELKLLSYIEARKEIYWKEYRDCVVKEKQFYQLRKRLEKGENLLIIEVDVCHQESLKYYIEKYNVSEDFIVNNTLLCTEYNLRLMLNDPKHPFGHGYCLTAALQGIELLDPPIKKQIKVIRKMKEENKEENKDPEKDNT